MKTSLAPAHTPGPWTIKDTPESSHHDHLVKAGNNTVASVAYQLEHHEAWCNAHLIAAAPELLEQLEALCVQIRASGNLLVPPNVDAAIRKARGAE